MLLPLFCNPFKLCVLLLCFPAFWVQAASDAELDRMLEGFMGSLRLDLDEKLKEPEQQWRDVADEFSVDVAYHYPLKRSDNNDGSGAQGTRQVSGDYISATTSWNPLSHWKATVTLYQYIDEDSQQSWEPDFTYSFGYSDWHPYTLSVMYANYGGNRFNPDSKKGERFSHFNQGTWSLGYGFEIPDEIQDAIRITDESKLDCSLGYHLTPRFSDPDEDQLRKWKQHGSLACKYTIFDYFYVNAMGSWYPSSSQQQAWDPDFTYGFGYSDWHKGTLSLQYNNYAGNRFFFNEQGAGFEDGTVSLRYSLKW